MVRQDPIFIASPPRCGTTMLAGLLYRHGVWVGPARTTMYPGTNSEFGSENLNIKAIMKDEGRAVGYKNWGPTMPVKTKTPTKDLKEKIEEHVLEDTPWLVKTSWLLTFSDFWMEAYPDARWVFPVRPMKNIIDSMNRHPGMRKHPDNEKNEYVRALLGKQSQINMKADYCTFVNVRAIANKESFSLVNLGLFLGIDFNRKVIEDWIQPNMMK